MGGESRKDESGLFTVRFVLIFSLPATVAVIILVFFPPACHAKPLPPRELSLMFEHFSTLEKEYESGKWDKALMTIDQIQKMLMNMLPELKKEVKTDIAHSFAFLTDKLRVSIMGRNSEETEKYYIVLQMMLFHIMDLYEYHMPPALPVIRKYIEEARDALKKGYLNDVRSEMNEIEMLFSKIEEQLSSKGAETKDTEKFSAVARKVHVLSETGKPGDMGLFLDELGRLCDKFISLYH